jgi:hypothetical protein
VRIRWSISFSDRMDRNLREQATIIFHSTTNFAHDNEFRTGLYRFRCLLIYIPDSIDEIKHLSIIHYSHPAQVYNIWDFSINHSIAQRRSYSCDKRSMDQADGNTSPCSATSSCPALEINIILPVNYWQHHVVCFEI